MRIITALRLPLLALATLAPSLVFGQDETDWTEFDSTVQPEQIESPKDASIAKKRTPFRRRIMRDDVSVKIKTLRLDSGEKVRLVYGMPKKAKNCPAVFVMDVETNAMAQSPGFTLPGLSSKQREEMKQAAYLLRSPFGSHMLGNGFGVAYIVADDLDAIRSARTADWVGIFNRVRDLKQVDDNSVFLFSTREYANLSVYLTSKYNFSGFILEEPTYMLFSRDPHEEIVGKSESLTPDEIWNRTDPTRAYAYRKVLGQISTPIMLIRNPDSSAYAFNQKTLISTLDEVNAYYQTVDIPGYARSLTTFGAGNGVMEIAPEVSYYPATVTRWVDEIITYMKVNSAAEAVALRDPANYRRW